LPSGSIGWGYNDEPFSVHSRDRVQAFHMAVGTGKDQFSQQYNDVY